MSSFNTVTAGNPTLATDINQYANILNGTTSGGVIVSGGAGAFVPYTASISALPSSGVSNTAFSAIVAGDAAARVGTFIHNYAGTGYGGVTAGDGTAEKANWYAQAGGWKTDYAVTVTGGLTVNNSITANSLSTTGAVSVGGTLSITGTVGAFATTGGIWINQQTAYGSSFPTIDLGIGDNASGIDWLGQNHLAIIIGGTNVLDLNGTGAFVPKTDTNGQTIHVGTATPASANAGDVWIKARSLNPFAAIFDREQCSGLSSYLRHTARRDLLSSRAWDCSILFDS